MADVKQIHSVRTQQSPATGRWVATCTCGETNASTYKPAVDVWRKNHLREAGKA